MILGLTDYWWEAWYSVSRGILELIDFVAITSNQISGIEDVTINYEKKSLLEYIFRHDSITLAFGVAAVCGVIFTFLFSVIQIIINFSSEKSEETPIQVLKKAFKNIFIAMLVPVFMYLFFILGNALVRAMYQATSQGNTSIAQYMFSIFADRARGAHPASIFTDGTVMWNSDFDTLWTYLDLSDYEYIYSFVIGGIILWALLATALMLVERIFSLALLYIISPLIIATSVLDDGQKFKVWREQVLIKFFTGFGAILGLNIYLLVIKIVTTSNVMFLEDPITNYFVKLIFIAGGAVCIRQIQAVIGNILSPGAGDKAIAEAQRANTGFTSGVGGVFSKPFGAIRNASNFARDARQYGFMSTLANRMGLKNQWDYDRDFALKNSKASAAIGGSGNYNGNKPNVDINQTIANSANQNNNQNGNQNNQRPNQNDNGPRNTAQTGKDMVVNLLQNSSNSNMK